MRTSCTNDITQQILKYYPSLKRTSMVWSVYLSVYLTEYVNPQYYTGKECSRLGVRQQKKLPCAHRVRIVVAAMVVGDRRCFLVELVLKCIISEIYVGSPEFRVRRSEVANELAGTFLERCRDISCAIQTRYKMDGIHLWMLFSCWLLSRRSCPYSENWLICEAQMWRHVTLERY